MEDYVLIDSVLQAVHMSKFNKKPKHLKKYQLNTIKAQPSNIGNKTICYDSHNTHNTRQNFGRFSMKPTTGTMTAQFFSSSHTFNNQKNKLKMKFILEQSQRISQNEKKQPSKQHFSEFFTKNLIQPKSCRQYCPRTVTLIRTPDTAKGVFYDTNIQFVRKKSRKCIILPERRKKKDENKNTKSTYESINLKNLIKQEWENQKRRRKAQCKTTSCTSRERSIMQKETKRSKQNEERHLKATISQKIGQIKLLQCSESFKKATVPLTKDEIRVKATDIMSKYGIDCNRCCFKMGNN